MTKTFPETLAPNFFHVDKLPDYGLKLFENELGREIRRYTEDTGYKTELKIQYNGLRSHEVKALTAFYLQVKGTFEKFTLPINFYRSPSSITNSLTALADTTEWRFMNPPMIQTVISDIYTVEIRLLSLKDSLNPDSSKIIGFVNSVNVDFILPTIILIPQQQVRELVPIALEFIISSIDLNQSVTVNSIDLTLETSELTFTTSGSVDSRSIQSLSLSFVTSQTGFGTLNSFEQMPSIIVSGTFTSLARYIHLVNTASGVASTTLPSNALDDTTIIYSDYAGTSTSSPTGFGLNAFTLNAPVGQTIQGQSSRVLNVENTSIQVIKKGNRWTIVGTELATGSGGGTTGIIPLVQMQGSTLESSWQGKLAYSDLNSGSFTLTIPDTTTNFPVGWFCYVRDDTQNGTITISPQNSNVELTAPNGLTLTKDDLYLFIHNGAKSWFIQKLTNIINTAGTGLALNSSKVLSNSFNIDSIGGQIEVPANKTYTLVGVAKFGFTIENISISTTSGTCTASLQINGVNVGGLSSISVTNSNQNLSSTSAKTVAVSGRVTLVITSNSSAADLVFSIGILKT
jgi:hypothetical protein